MCVYTGKTQFKDGSNVPEGVETVYLGGVLTTDHNLKKEVSAKIGSCFGIIKKLDLFWNNNNCPQSFKLQVLDAVVRSKLVYGLESVMISRAVMSRLNSFSSAKGPQKDSESENYFHRPQQLQ